MLFIFALYLGVAAAVFAQDKSKAVGDSKLVKACGIEFYIPSDFKEKKVKPFDSCVRQYQNKEVVIFLDVLGFIIPAETSFKDEFSDKQNFNLEEIKLDGRRAEIITYFESEKKGFSYRAVLFVPVITSRWGHLDMRLFTKTSEQRNDAIKIFKSLRFPDE